MAKTNLPAEVHDHFRKANKLHEYIEKSFGETLNYAFDLGNELLAAKGATPHGSWEKECDRLFVGKSRTARFYMEFSRNWALIPKRQRLPISMLECTLTGAAKAAKKTAAELGGKQPPKRRKPPEEEVIDVEFEEIDGEPRTTPGEDTESTRTSEDSFSRSPRSGKEKPAASKPPKKLDKPALYKEWDRAIGPICRLVDRIANDVGQKNCQSHKTIVGQLDACTEEMQEWLGVRK
ncbi:hypothetical protein [Petrachloros mirabilis]